MLYKKNANIIIIDDELEICELMKTVLENQKFNVQYFTQSRDFFNQFKQYNHNNLDLMIVDLMMPEIDGFQILELLNSKDDTRFIPKIVISAYPTTDNIKDVFEYGVIQFIQKPLSFEELIYQVKTLLRIKLYEDNNRIIIKLLKEQNKKLQNQLQSNKNTNNKDINQVGSMLVIISDLINQNYKLSKKVIDYTRNIKPDLIENDSPFKELMASIQELNDKRNNIDQIEKILNTVIQSYQL